LARQLAGDYFDARKVVKSVLENRVSNRNEFRMHDPPRTVLRPNTSLHLSGRTGPGLIAC